jgi:O-antigen/teichoic acid export membrane protein
MYSDRPGHQTAAIWDFLLGFSIDNQHFKTFDLFPNLQQIFPMASVGSKSGSLLDVGSAKTGAEREFVSDSIAAGVIFALVVTVGQRFIGFGRGILFCRLMTDQQLGQWSMAWSYLMLLAPLAVLGLPGCFGKFTEHFRTRGQLKTFVARISLISVVTTLLMSGTIIVIPEQFSWLLFRDPSQIVLVRCLGLALIAITASNFLSTLLESLRQVRVVTIMRFITGTMFAVVGAGLLLVWQDGASAATIGFAISCCIGMLPAIWVLWRYRIGMFEGQDVLTHGAMWKRIAPFAIWLWVSNLLNNLLEVSDRYMLIHWSKLSPDLAQGTVGQYHSGRVVPLLLVSIAAMLAGVLLPYLSQSWESGDRTKVTRQLNWTLKLIAISFTFGGVLILWFSPLLFDWILQGRYNAGLAILPLTLVYCIWGSLMMLGQDYLWVAEKGKWAALATGAGLIINVGINMILIPVIGLNGAVIATAIGNATILVLIFAMNHRFGCKTDVGIWLCTLLPLTLVLPKHFAAIAIFAIVLIGCFTNRLLNAEEKIAVQQTVRDKLGRFFPHC